MPPVFTLVERGTELYSVAIYIGGLTRFYLRVRGFALNTGMIWRPKGASPRVIPFLRLGNPSHPIIRLGA